MKIINKSVLLLAIILLTACATKSYDSPEMKIGSRISKNLFIDSSQFANNNIRVRLRNTSGVDSISITSFKSDIEAGLTNAGYKVTDDNVGIVVDINLYFMNTIANAKQQSGGLAILFGGVVGYELAKNSGGISGGSGAIIGAIAGPTLSKVMGTGDENHSYIVACDINIGVFQKLNENSDSFSIGGSKVESYSDTGNSEFKSFARQETVKVTVYASDNKKDKNAVMMAIQSRLVSVISNLI